VVADQSNKLAVEVVAVVVVLVVVVVVVVVVVAIVVPVVYQARYTYEVTLVDPETVVVR